MKTNKFRNILGITIALLFCTVTAAQAENPGVYVGAALGSYNINDGNLDNNDRVLKTLVGLQFNNFFALEGAWTDFNRVNNGSDRFESDGHGVAVVLSLPVGIFVKGGQFWWNSNAVLNGASQSSDGHDPFWGAGFRFGFNDNLALRLEAERYDVLNTHINTYTAGLDFKF
jgi:OOP family OmpA-OmpF porin